MLNHLRLTTIFLLAILPNLLPAQSAPDPKAPDTLTFINGEHLTGTLEKADAAGITFKSPMAGDLTVKWANIKDLQTDKHFALLTKKEKLTRRDAAAVVPQGPIHVADKQITVTTATGPKVIPTADADLLIDAAGFNQAITGTPGLFDAWTGTASAGLSLVRATQNDTSFNGAITLTRATPEVSWLPPRTRTTVNYTQAYGTVTQPGSATVETNIFHAQAEQDQYFTPRLFAFGSATFDHNFSQSLALQQAYGAGAGISLIHTAARQLDLKGDLQYEEQSFFIASQNLNLIGSTFSETYLQKFLKVFALNEFGSISPAWNDLNAYSSHVNATVGFPVYRGLGFNIGAVDDYLNNAPPGSKRNSTQFTTNLTYTFKPH